jgi:hypothetical protein
MHNTPTDNRALIGVIFGGQQPLCWWWKGSAPAEGLKGNQVITEPNSNNLTSYGTNTFGVAIALADVHVIPDMTAISFANLLINDTGTEQGQALVNTPKGHAALIFSAATRVTGLSWT